MSWGAWVEALSHAVGYAVVNNSLFRFPDYLGAWNRLTCGLTLHDVVFDLDTCRC